MIKCAEFGAADKGHQREFLNAFQRDNSVFITYQLLPTPEYYADDDNLDDVVSNCVHLYQPEMGAILEACVRYTVFKYICKKHDSGDSSRIVSETSAVLELIRSKRLDELEKDLLCELNREIGLCLYANADLKHWDYLNERLICKNNLIFHQGSLQKTDNAVVWYRYDGLDDVISELGKFARFDFFLTQGGIEDHFAAFEIDETGDTYDLRIYMSHEDENEVLRLLADKFSDFSVEQVI